MTEPASDGDRTDGADGISRIRLVAAPDVDLTAPRLGETLVAAAEGAAERIGVRLHTATIEPDGLLLAVAGPMLVAFGLAAEIRRATDRWHLDRTGRHLWITPEDESTP